MEIRLPIACLVFSLFITIFAETGNDVNSLLTNVYTTRGYNKKIRPMTDQTKVLTIEMDFFLNCKYFINENIIAVIDFDEKTESLKTSGYLSIVWNDEYFTWSPASFNNTESVFVPQDDIWKPDISLRNSFKSFTGLGSSYLNLLVQSEGLVNWYPLQVLESTCSVSITYFPFDVQACELKFSAWSYSKNQVTISMGKKGIELGEYVPNSSWEVIDTDAEEIQTEAAVVFIITLKRKPKFFIINIIIPVIFLSVLNIFSFFLPVISGERAGYSITVFLSLAVFLTIVSDQLPRNSENTSLLGVYIMLVTALSTMIVMICMVQLRLQSWNDTNKPINKFFRNFVTLRDCLHCRICKKRLIAPKEQTSSTPSLESDSDAKSDVTWLDVANAMDLIFFIGSILYTFICTLVIGVMAVNGGSQSSTVNIP